MVIEKLILRDINPNMVAAWRFYFPWKEVKISEGDIFKAGNVDAIISPANSFGFMDGGIDKAYSEYIGQSLARRLRELIALQHHGELPVGQAVIISTNHKDIPWLISAPTMRIPEIISETRNSYLAFRAAMIAAQQHGGIKSILCPGLGTAVGRMDPKRCAKQMSAAYSRMSPKWSPEAAFPFSLDDACQTDGIEMW